MILLPLQTPLLKKGDDLAVVFAKHAEFSDGDVLIISSKAIATCEGAAIDLRSRSISTDAQSWAKQSGQDPCFAQAIIDETQRLHGNIIGACPGALLTELRPDGFPDGRLLVPNAGLDQSNIEEGFAIGWPRDPVASAIRIRTEIEKELERSGKRKVGSGKQNEHFPLSTAHSARIAVVISDSCCVPGRLGVTAFALTVSGIDPFASEVGKPDLFGRSLRVTQEAIVDQLATAANAVMGNADQSTPAAIIRDHGLTLSDFEGWVPGIEPEEDLFRGMFEGK